jgi:phage terminase large subunit-like protein
MLAKIEINKRRALADLYYFDKYVLGYHLMVPHVHEKLCKFVTREMKKGKNEQGTKMILMPRNSFKSTAVTVGYCLWRLANNPNLTILITNEKLDKSKAFLKEIKSHITTNPRFKLLLGEWSCENKPGKKWSETRIEIMPRVVHSAAPSIEVSSVESSETGKHVDLIICDDMQGASNITTKEQIAKVVEYWKDLQAVLKPGGEIVMIGTRWDYKDIYQYIFDLKEELGELANIEILVEKAVRDDGTYLFPEVLSEAFLKRQRATLGSYFFGAQYNNEPVEKEGQLVKKILKYGDTIDGMELSRFFDRCQNFITVDLAFTENKRSDSSVIVCNAVNRANGRRYVRQYDILKTGDPDKIIELLFDYNKKFKPVRFGIEKNNYISWLKKPLEDRMRACGVYLPIDPPDGIPHYGKDANKAMRLRGIAPAFNYGEWWIADTHTELEDELLKLTFDGARGHDDLLDAMSMLNEICMWGVNATGNKFDNEEAGLRDKINAANSGLIEYDGSDFDLNEKSWMYM